MCQHLPSSSSDISTGKEKEQTRKQVLDEKKDSKPKKGTKIFNGATNQTMMKRSDQNMISTVPEEKIGQLNALPISVRDNIFVSLVTLAINSVFILFINPVAFGVDNKKVEGGDTKVANTNAMSRKIALSPEEMIEQLSNKGFIQAVHDRVKVGKVPNTEKTVKYLIFIPENAKISQRVRANIKLHGYMKIPLSGSKIYEQLSNSKMIVIITFEVESNQCFVQIYQAVDQDVDQKSLQTSVEDIENLIIEKLAEIGMPSSYGMVCRTISRYYGHPQHLRIFNLEIKQTKQKESKFYKETILHKNDQTESESNGEYWLLRGTNLCGELSSNINKDKILAGASIANIMAIDTIGQLRINAQAMQNEWKVKLFCFVDSFRGPKPWAQIQVNEMSNDCKPLLFSYLAEDCTLFNSNAQTCFFYNGPISVEQIASNTNISDFLCGIGISNCKKGYIHCGEVAGLAAVVVKKVDGEVRVIIVTQETIRSWREVNQKMGEPRDKLVLCRSSLLDQYKKEKSMCLISGLKQSEYFKNSSCLKSDVCTKRTHEYLVIENSKEASRPKSHVLPENKHMAQTEGIRQVEHHYKAEMPIQNMVIEAIIKCLTEENYQGVLNLAIPDEIVCFFVYGLSHFKLKNYTSAMEYFSKCNELCIMEHQDGDSALCNCYLGDIQYVSRDFKKARDHYETAITKYSNVTLAAKLRMIPPSKSTIYAKCGSALRNDSKMVEAIQKYESAIKAAETPKDLLAAHTSLGNLYQSVGENSTALPHYKKSIELSKSIHNHISLGWAHGNIGNAYLGLFQKDLALYHLKESLKLTKEYERTPQAIGRAYNNLGTAYQSIGDLEEAEKYYKKAYDQAVRGNDEAGQARVCGNMGNVMMLRKQYEKAVSQYSEVLSLSADPATCSTAHHNRGCAYYEWGESMRSERRENITSVTTEEQCASKKATFLTFGSDFIQPYLNPNMEACYQQGFEDLNEVVRFHEANLNSIKGSSKGLTLSVSLFEVNSRTFHRLQDCLIGLRKYDQALLVAEQSRARTLGELMLKRKRGRLEYEVCSPLPFSKIVEIVGRSSHPILYLSYTGARLLGWVFVMVQNEVKMDTFYVPLEDDQFDGKSLDHHLRCNLTETLVERSFEMYREVGNYEDDTSSPVQVLYDLVAKPLLAILAKYKLETAAKIVVIPDTYTALLPFASLYNQEKNTFLGDQYSFQIMPSLLTMDLLNQLGNTNTVIFPEDDHHLCVVGNPSIPQFLINDEVWNLGSLPHAKKEAESVAHILRTTPILENQATKKSILMKFMNAKVIHLATHGSASFGFLAFGTLAFVSNKKAVSPDAVLLYPKEVEELKISPALVVLSSCDSGRGAVKADGIQGMARAFILAGAQAVLTTLWRVPDESASIFMQFFYQYMMDGLESTKALQKAILSIRCFSKYSQYIHWSGYQLTGRDIYFKYSTTADITTLEKRLGKSSEFPRLSDLKALKSGLVDCNSHPTDVQIILESSPGLDAHEIVIDFVHNNYKYFNSGIFWINCKQPEFITYSIDFIEKNIGKSLDKISLSEVQQCLIIFDGITELPASEPLLRFMRNRYSHCIMIYRSIKPVDSLIRSVDKELLRGCNTHQLESLSAILSTQRIVYALQKGIHFCPKREDQVIMKEITNFASGSPVIVHIISRILPIYFNDASGKTVDALMDFAHNINLDVTRVKSSSASSDSFSSSLSHRPLCSSVTDSIPSISILTPDCRDEWDTPCNYDSWDSIALLLHASHLDEEAILLLNCLAHFGCPVPIHAATSLSSLIVKTTGKSHLSGLLLDQLLTKGFVKMYPCAVVIHKSLKSDDFLDFIYVPIFIRDYLLKEQETQDRAIAFTTCFHSLSNCKSRSECIFGLLKSFMETLDLNYEAMGISCYTEIYKYYLSLI